MAVAKHEFAKKIAVAVIGVVLSFIISASAAATTWTVSKILRVEERVVRLEENRPTKDDMKEIQGDIAVIRETIARMDERNKQSDDRDAEIKDRLDDLVTLVVNIDQRLIRLETVIRQPRGETP